MSTVKLIIAGIGSAIGIAFLIFVGLMAWQIKGAIVEGRNKKDIADSVRLEGVISEIRASLQQKDSTALVTSRTFVTARETQRRNPVVTGGGKRADSVANAAVNACYETATRALTACQVARITADSLPTYKDSLNAVTLRLAKRQNQRWTAAGLVGYAWPMQTPAIGVESDLRGPFSITLNARADAIPFYKPQSRADSLAYGSGKWRATTSLKIPFR